MTNEQLLKIAGSVAFARLELDETQYKLDQAEYLTALNCVRTAIARLELVKSALEKGERDNVS